MKRLLLLAALLGLSLPSFAQVNDSLIVLWLSEPGVRPVQILEGLQSDGASRFDLDGDGLAELILQRDDSEGNLQDLVINPTYIDTLDGLWPDVQQTLSLSGKAAAAFEFWGFADADGDGVREALFFNDVEVALIDPRARQQVNWRSSYSSLGLPPDLRLLGAADLTGDGVEEIVIALPQARQVALLGAGSANAARR